MIKLHPCFLAAIIAAAVSAHAQSAATASAPAGDPVAAVPVVADPTAAAPAVPEPDTVVMSPFEVNSSGDRGYVAGNAVSATRINVGINDLPFSITAFTPQFIADTGAQNLMDVVTQAAGVKSGQGTGIGTSNAIFTIRGFIQTPQRNGFSSNAQTSTYVDGSVVDRVEIVKGPASLLYGAISPGGTVNYITKSAQEQSFEDLHLTFGSYNNESASVDVNHAIVPGKVLFRVVATDQTTEEYAVGTKGHTTVLYPTVKWIVTPTSTLTFDYQWLHRRDTPPPTYLPNTDVASPASVVSALYGAGYPGAASLLSGKTGPGAATGFNDASDPGFMGAMPGIPKNFSTSDMSDVMVDDQQSINGVYDIKINSHWSARAHLGIDDDRENYRQTGHSILYLAPPNSLDFSNGKWSVAPSWAALSSAQQIAQGLAYAQQAVNNPQLQLSTQNGTPSPALMDRAPRDLESWAYGTTIQGEAVGIYNFPQATVQILSGVFYDSVYATTRTTQNKANAAYPYFRTWDVNSASPTYYVNQNEGGFLASQLATVSAWSTAYNQDKAAYGLVNANFFQGRLYLVGGARYNVSEGLTTDHVANKVSQGFHDKYTTPQVGLGYKITQDIMVYSSYSESYSLPASPTLLTAGVVNGIPTQIPTGSASPTIGKGYEAGIKADLLDHALNATVSVYQIEQSNVQQQFSQNVQGFAVNTISQGAVVRGRGVEATVNWSPVKNLSIVANASEEDLRNTQEPAGLEYYLGQTPNFAAKTQANLWVRYDLPSAWAKGLWVGGGFDYVGKNAGDRRDSAYFLPAYTVYNSAIGYDWKWNKTNMSAILNIKNMGDTFYRATPDAITQPRRLLLSLTIHH